MGCMIKTKIESFIAKRRCTLLGIGPMSKNCVDASIEIANDYEIPLILVASRRQIEAAEFGGGYVNNWSTESFAEYVIERDKKGKIILARDHGGPWQSQWEKDQKLSLKKAMESAKTSYQADIKSGFEIIHIDPSVDIYSNPSVDETLLRIFELYEFCWKVASDRHRQIIFEIGTEEQSGSTDSLETLEYVVQETIKFCQKHKILPPTFLVAQIGTRVMETRNVGSFDSPFRIVGELPAEIQVPKIIDFCNRYGIMLKAHNDDYLSDEALSWHPKLGIHAANVAPEFGVTETKAFLDLLWQYNLTDLADSFIKLAYESKKWMKWMLPDTQASLTEKAIIAGHYVFATPTFQEIQATASSKLKDKEIDLDEYLKSKVKASIFRYVKHFRLSGI